MTNPVPLTAQAVLDPRIGLATSLQSSPGVYALLLGSGVSTGAGVPTGWGVVTDLVRRAATAAGADVGEDFESEGWWAANGDGRPLGYSSLLEALADTAPARRALLARFFEPSESDRESGLKVPGAAHRAIAQLVKRGTVRVILTTNFDRLLEQALEAEGIFPQVVATPTAVEGMEPLAHSRCTIVKLHGDYASLDQLNTEEELSQYESGLEALLDRVLDEYGLIISGWSADWDTALVSRIEAMRSRRYPLYWAARSGLGEEAQRLVALRRATVIENADADAFFPGLLSRLESLDRMSATPLSRTLAVVQLKRLLPYATKHIELRDLLEPELDKLSRFISDLPNDFRTDPQWLQETHAALVEASTTVMHLVATAVYFDRERLHTDVWIWVIERLMRARRPPNGMFYERLETLRHLPALLVLYAGGLSAVAVGRDDVLRRLLSEPTWQELFSNRGEATAGNALHTMRVLDSAIVNAFPKWGSEWLWPQSHFLREALTPIVGPLVGDEDSYKLLFSRTEYRIALSQVIADTDDKFVYGPIVGEFIGEWMWDAGVPKMETDFRTNASGSQWGWDQASDDAGAAFEAKLVELRDYLAKAQRWG